MIVPAPSSTPSPGPSRSPQRQQSPSTSTPASPQQRPLGYWMRPWRRGWHRSARSPLTAIAFLTAAFLPNSLTLAEPASLFQPHVPTILASAPPGYPLRLPTQLLLPEGQRLNSEDLTVKVYSSATPLSVTVSLFKCESQNSPCLLGTITADRATAVHATQELTRHKALGLPITLRSDIRAYIIDGLEQKPTLRFSSISWRQDDSIYTLSFPAGNRQNLMTMAYTMAHSAPLRSPLARAIPASLPPRGLPAELSRPR